MSTINEQLNIPILKAGETMYQPNLYGGGLDNYFASDTPFVVGTAYYQGANGESWSGCNSCGGFSSATGGDRVKFEICVGKCQILYRSSEKRKKCTDECKAKHGITDIATYVTAGQSPQVTQQIKDKLPDTLGGNKQTNTGQPKTNLPETDPANLGMSKNTKIMLGVGILAVAGIAVLMLRRRS
jgi:hypothetical protein